MKKVVALMLGLIAGTASFAHPSTVLPSVSQPRLVMTPNHQIKLYVAPVQTKGQLAIRDAQGQTIYQTTVGLQKGLRQQFDCSNLSTGTYQLILTTGQQTLTRTFIVQADPNTSFVVQEL